MDRLKILAELFLDSQWTLPAIEELVRRFTSPKSRARKSLGSEIHARFPRPPSRSALVAFLKAKKRSLGSKQTWSRIQTGRKFGIKPTTMRCEDAPTFASAIPALPTVAALAEWCGQPVGLVDWLSEHRKDHYRISTIPKRSGGLRILESPRLRLKAIQRSIANGLLQCIPCHTSAHGFVRGRSAIALDEGFQVQFRKTRIMRAAMQQSAAGIVLNQGTNAKRTEFDLLKATLFNSVRHGPSTQNRDCVSDFQSHLRGRINWVRQLNPARGEKLMAMFHAIDWSR